MREGVRYLTTSRADRALASSRLNLTAEMLASRDPLATWMIARR